eukprot:COSAG01_NODE_7828_length_3038_cov_1.237155_4_plen_122_part_00
MRWPRQGGPARPHHIRLLLLVLPCWWPGSAALLSVPGCAPMPRIEPGLRLESMGMAKRNTIHHQRPQAHPELVLRQRRYTQCHAPALDVVRKPAARVYGASKEQQQDEGLRMVAIATIASE